MIDLHTHSTASDGALAPADLVAHAHAAGVRLLALTDHDTTAGCAEAAAAAAQRLRFIPGVELEAAYPRFGTCHIVGLNIDPDAPALRKLVEQARHERLNRNMLLLRRLQEVGIEIDAEAMPGGLHGAGRLHFAQELVRAGTVQSVQEAFTAYLGPSAETFAARNTPSVGRCLHAIGAAGGISVIAHPTTLHLSWSRLEAQLRAWRDEGLTGMEVLFPGAFRRTMTKLTAMAERLGLEASAGSDFHDAPREPGRVFSRDIPDSLIPPSLADPGLTHS
jgi:predicted metal-dependent phosphoesterase TrpH